VRCSLGGYTDRVEEREFSHQRVFDPVNGTSKTTETEQEERKTTTANMHPAHPDGPYLTTAYLAYPYDTLDLISVPHARTTRGVAPAHA
jgi:hypothetical protein